MNPSIPANQYSPASIRHAPLLDGCNAMSVGPLLVVLSWAQGLAILTGVTLTVSQFTFLGTAIWLGYTADRLCDSRCIPVGVPLAPRHRIIRNLEHPIRLIWAAVLAISLLCGYLILDSGRFWSGILLAALAALYTFSNRYRLPPVQWKEGSTGLLLTLAVLYFPAGQIAPVHTAAVLPLPLLFAANCHLIAAWDTTYDRRIRQRSPGDTWRQNPYLCRGLSTLAAAGFLIVCMWLPFPAPWAFSGMLSATLLMGLSFRKPGAEQLPHYRLLADLAVAAPVIFILWRAAP